MQMSAYSVDFISKGQKWERKEGRVGGSVFNAWIFAPSTAAFLITSRITFETILNA